MRRPMPTIHGSRPTDGPGPKTSSPAAAPKLIRLGRITGIHGLRGALRFRPDNPDSDSIQKIERVFLDLAGTLSEYRLAGSAPLGHNTVRLSLEGINDPDHAEGLKGATVMAAESDLPEAGGHEFYYYQTIGCEVVLTDGTPIGKIEEVFSTGANDVFVVRGEREILVPVIADVVKSIDLNGRRVTIEAVPGLLD